MKAHLNLVTVNALTKFSDLDNGVFSNGHPDDRYRSQSQEGGASYEGSSQKDGSPTVYQSEKGRYVYKYDHQ